MEKLEFLSSLIHGAERADLCHRPALFSWKWEKLKARRVLQGSGVEGLAGGGHSPALTFDVEGGVGTAGLLSGGLVPSHALESARVLQPVHSREAQAAALGETPLGVLDRGPVQQPVHMHRA